jgi:hypothetical protein
LILVPPNHESPDNHHTQQLLSAVDSESLDERGGCGVSSMALTGFTNTLPVLKTNYQDDLMDASRGTNVNPILSFLSSSPSISVEKPIK